MGMLEYIMYARIIPAPLFGFEQSSIAGVVALGSTCWELLKKEIFCVR